MANYLIIAAGGNGQRFGHDKIFIDLLGKPVISHTLSIVKKSKLFNGLIITIRRENKDKLKKLIKKLKIKNVLGLVENDGSDTRQTLVLKALLFLKGKIKEADLVGVHNAVNPFVKIEELKRVFNAAKTYQAAILAMKARDTVKVVNEKMVVQKTPKRKLTFYAQTPQVAKFNLLYQAYKKAEADNFSGTDDSSLLERMGIKVKLVECSPGNLKITYPYDLGAGEKILKGDK